MRRLGRCENLSGENRWSAALTGAATLIAAVSLLANQINSAAAVAPLVLIEWHQSPDMETSFVVFRNEGIGTAILQDIGLVVEKRHAR